MSASPVSASPVSASPVSTPGGRRSAAALVVCLGLLVATLAGCDKADQAPTTPPAPAPTVGAPSVGGVEPTETSSKPTPTNTAFPVSVEHRYGTTVVSAPPQRVVIVGRTEQDTAAALGVVPVATTEWIGKQPGGLFPWARKGMGGAPLPAVLDATKGLQLARIKALRPDLILAVDSDLTAADYATLTAIAPTVAQPPGPTGRPTWQDVARTTGVALGQPVRARELVDFGEGILANGKRRHPDWTDAPAVVLDVPASATSLAGVRLAGSSDPLVRLMVSMTFKAPAKAGTNGVPLPAAGGAAALNAPVVVLRAANRAAATRVLADPAFKRLPVAIQGRTVVVAPDKDDLYASTLQFVSVLSLPTMLDTLIVQLERASDGDPTTKIGGVGTDAAKPAEYEPY